MRESEIQTAIRLELGRDADLVLWRNSAGVAYHEGRKQRFGLVRGASDLLGILTVAGLGVFVALEIKASRGRLTDEQRLFGDLVTRRGGFFAVVRSPDEARAAIDRARKEIRERIRSAV